MTAPTVEPNTAVVGLQWGDEGKGKIIDLLAGRFAAVVRYNGGANAGHSVVINGQRHALHLVPSGVFHKGVRAVIGNGVVIDPVALVKELDQLASAGADLSSLAISSRAHLVLDYHKTEDALRETLLSKGAGSDPDNTVTTDRSIGTTRRGIGPAYSDKAARSSAIRVGDLLHPDRLRRKIREVCEFKNRLFRALDDGATPLSADAIYESVTAAGARLKPFITDTAYLLHDLVQQKRPILFEGANATLLDVDHGTFPYVTSSTTCALGIPAGAGVPPRALQRTIGVMKAYSTRVGGGPFPTELLDDTGHRIRERGREYGTTTGRPRRCGWLDLVATRYSVMLNGCDAVAIMLLDVLAGFDELRICTAYEIDGERTDRFTPDADDLARARPVYESLPGFKEEIAHAKARAELPANARKYVERIESFIGAPASIISVGPDRAQTITT
ncbi:MAG TPA: adenylosuccinate synthase [Phycisphaerales bacterium]|nr:adenylosuccinate synthase [Phycisphaerales bacterium]